MKVYCDSSTKEACWVIDNQPPRVEAYSEPVTVNVGEYKAAIWALCDSIVSSLRSSTPKESIELLSDSQLVVNQTNGLAKCRKKRLLPFHARLCGILALGRLSREIIIRWIPREENLAGIWLEKGGKVRK